MLHVVTEIGKPGRDEREKKHFPTLSNTETNQKYQPRGRRYIPHGYGDDYEFHPHPQHIDPAYTECGPDWKSRLRWIPSPHNPDYPAEENWPEPWKPMRTYPWMSRRTGQEWVLYPEGNDATLRSTWDGVHKATEVTDKEITHSMLFGKGKMVVDKRNGIPMAAAGDKSYQAVEYSPQFYKYGSTLPVVNFGGTLTFRPDTFVPLSELPPVQRENFTIKERRRKQQEEVEAVKYLDRWRPATPLQAPNHGGIGPMSIPERTELSSLSKY